MKKKHTIQEENKISLFTDGMILCVENLKDLAKKQQLLTDNYNKVTEYWVNIQKSIIFPYISNEKEEVKIKNTMPFSLAPQQKKCLAINLTKHVQNLFEYNYKTLLKKIKEELNKLRDIPCLWLERLNIVMILFLPN